MPTYTVRFKRPPAVAGWGTDWIPLGLEYRPFFDRDKDTPSDTEERQFECSRTLESYLLEFNSLRVPTISSFDDADDICRLQSRCQSQPEVLAFHKAAAFKTRVLDIILDRCRELSSDAKERVVFHPDAERLAKDLGPDQQLAYQVINADMHSTDHEFIELKAWICLLAPLSDYLFRWKAFVKDVDDRHSLPHTGCTYVPRTSETPAAFHRIMSAQSKLKSCYGTQGVSRRDFFRPPILLLPVCSARHLSSFDTCFRGCPVAELEPNQLSFLGAPNHASSPP
ncbi:hypothetical protein B0H16DRAFT_1532374 [Mycena metata]|uniref:Uncharacterized protein n=1 Tax=Mycena metata TaxID=1033252 RepID=A0AAD7JBJ2_9AGAR|nr:hypothetical protein B0H16DRAFT_1532374 [Mycena metata]